MLKLSFNSKGGITYLEPDHLPEERPEIQRAKLIRLSEIKTKLAFYPDKKVLVLLSGDTRGRGGVSSPQGITVIPA